MIKIVTDSGSGIIPEVAQQYGITVVPLYVHFGTEVFREGLDIQLPEFLSRLKASPQLPTTSQPSAGDFLQIYGPLTANGDEVISIHLSSLLSGTFASACTAREMLPNCQIHVVDSRSVSVGQGMMAINAAHMASAGESTEAILNRLDQYSAGTHIYFVVDTLEYLQKGGRIGKAAALLGTALQVKPILTINNGLVEAKERTRTKSKAIARIEELVLSETAGRTCRYLNILHAAAPEEAQQVASDLVPQIKPGQTMTSEIGPVLATYTGPGVVGVAFYAD